MNAVYENGKLNMSGIAYVANAAFLADDSAAVTVNPGTLIAAFIVANTNATINLTGTLNTSTGAEIAMQKNSQNGQQGLLRLVK